MIVPESEFDPGYTVSMQSIERIREVLELIVCPACQGSLNLSADTVQCNVCGRRYPVVDGIPVLRSEQAPAGPPSK
jgi:uncharacterized protein